MTLQAIRYRPSTLSAASSLEIIDQLSLPHHTTYLPVPTAATAHAAIKQMSVRGAPAIAIVAALSVAVETSALTTLPATAAEMRAFVEERLEYLLTSRPTAVNLRDAVGKLGAVVRESEAS